MLHPENSPSRDPQTGQSLVLLALLMVVLVALAALAVDGGNAFFHRRNAQNAADAAALGGTQYITNFTSKSETGLRERVNAIVEAHGVADTDGTPGNSVNGNVAIFYTDDRGVRLTGCNTAPCGSIPVPAHGIEVEITDTFGTYMAGVVGRNELTAGASAVAYARNTTSGGNSEIGMLSLGEDCGQLDIPYDGSGYYSEIIGGVHSNAWLEVRGNDIHFHGQASYTDGYVYTGTGAQFDPATPRTSPAVADPFSFLNVDDFARTGSIGSTLPSGEFHDLSGYNQEIDMRLLRDLNLYDDRARTFASGLYFAGNNDVKIGDDGASGVITVVTHGLIKITGKNITLTAYMPDGSAIPGLLFFTDYAFADRCANGVDYYVINMTGSNSNQRPRVDHDGACPYPQINGCYTASSTVYTGLVYAPNGRIATSGDNGTYIGAIIGYTVRLNGNRSLIVVNPRLYPPSDTYIYLGR